MIKGKVIEIIGIYANIWMYPTNPRRSTIWWNAKGEYVPAITTHNFYYDDVKVGDEVESEYGRMWSKSLDTVTNVADFTPPPNTILTVTDSPPLTIQANTPICKDCGQLDIRIPRLGIWHACPNAVKVEHDE